MKLRFRLLSKIFSPFRFFSRREQKIFPEDDKKSAALPQEVRLYPKILKQVMDKEMPHTHPYTREKKRFGITGPSFCRR